MEIGAFRTFPEGYKPPDEGPSEYQTIPLSKIEDFGVHASQYYTLDVSFFKAINTCLLTSPPKPCPNPPQAASGARRRASPALNPKPCHMRPTPALLWATQPCSCSGSLLAALLRSVCSC